MAEENKSIEVTPSLCEQAFAVFSNYIASDVSNENSRLEEENLSLEPLRNYLKNVEIRSDDDDGLTVISFPGLENAIMKEMGGHNCVSLSIDEPVESMPLAKFRAAADGTEGSARGYMSNQIVGRFPGTIHPVLREVDGDSILLDMLDVSGKIALRGTVTNLSNQDVERITSEGEGFNRECETIGRYLLRQGEDLLNSPNATFVPALFMVIGAGGEHRGIERSVHILNGPTRNEHKGLIQQLRHSIEVLTSNLETLEINQSTVVRLAEQIREQSQQWEEGGLSEEQEELLNASLGLREETREQIAIAERQFHAAKELLEVQTANYSDCFDDKPPSDRTASNGVLTPPADLRTSVFAVDNKPENAEMLKRNRQLEAERKNLADIRAQIGAVDVSFRDGKVSVSLLTGVQCCDDNGEAIWRIPFEGRGHPVDMSKVYSLAVSLSGVGFRKKSWRVRMPDPLSITFEMSLYGGLALKGRFSSDSSSSMLELNDPFTMRCIVELPDAPLPPDCAFHLTSLDFRLASIKDALDIVRLQPNQPGSRRSA